MTRESSNATPYQEIVINPEVQRTMGALAHTIASRPRDHDPRAIPELVHTFDTLDYIGCDGDDGGGYIGFGKVTTTDDRELATIRSWQVEFSSSLPYPGNSWSAEFDDVGLAKEFWKKTWRPNFRDKNFVEAANAFIKERQITVGMRFQQLGLLNAWYEQQEGQEQLLTKFSTGTDTLVQAPRKLLPHPDFIPGQVFRVPQFNWFSTRVIGRNQQTCLAAFEAPRHRHTTSENPAIVQWEDGSLGTYNYSHGMPEPVRRIPKAQ